MMFSAEKCSGHGTGTSEECDLFTGGGEAVRKEGVPSDEVASAVAAVSDEIGDILKDELGDVDRADRIGAELADLSAELGLLAGLADGEAQQDFPSLFEIAMGHRASGSGSSSSSSWSGARTGRVKRTTRHQRARRRPIAKGKEISRRRSTAARRAASARARRAEVASDASDVGADSDDDDQWTELDDHSGTSDSSSVKASALGDLDCNGYHREPEAEAPALGQFLLPLFSAEPVRGARQPEHFLIRHEDILQLLASTEDGAREELHPEEDASLDTQSDVLSNDVFVCDETPVTPEEEAALLHYVCEADRSRREAGCRGVFSPVHEWLLGVYHSWCEISALMYTLVGTNMSVEMVSEDWSYRARFGCHCRLCLCLASNDAPLAAFLQDVVWALAHGGSSVTTAARIMRVLKLGAAMGGGGGGAEGEEGGASAAGWDIPRLQAINYSDDDAAIIHEQLCRLSQQSELTQQIVTDVCLCRRYDRPLDKQYAVERFCKILENYKAVSTITFKVEVTAGAASAASAAGAAWAEGARRRLARFLRRQRRARTADRLRDVLRRTAPADLSAWAGYKHRCDCLTPRTRCAQQRKQLLRISFFGMMQAVNEFNGAKESQSGDERPSKDVQSESTTGRELQQGDGTGAKPPDSESHDSNEKTDSSRDSGRDLSDSNPTIDLDDISDSDANSGTASLGLSTSSSLDSASELLLAAAAAVESAGSEGEAAPGELCRTVRHLMRSIASIERLMDRVLKHCDEWPAPPSRADHEARKRVDIGLSEVDRKLMAMYRRLPEVHRRQLQVYRKQKKLSTVCMQLVGGRAPAPPPPGSPPPAPAHASCRTLCPEYHLQRFKEVRRKVMHMRDQQLYYHRLRMWLEDQLRQERESLPESNVTLVEDLPRRKRSASAASGTGGVGSAGGAGRRKLKASAAIGKPQRLLHALRARREPEPPDAFALRRGDASDDTVVGERDRELADDMKECLAKFADFALAADRDEDSKYPEAVSPPLQEVSPTTTEPVALYAPKQNQILAINKLIGSGAFDKVTDVQPRTPELNVPLNARRSSVLVNDESQNDKIISESVNMASQESKDPNVYKYVTFGLELKKAMEDCQNIINSYNIVKDKDDGKENDDGLLSLEQICEVMMSIDKNSAEFLDKMDDESVDTGAANTKLAEFVENMPQILANMPEIASKFSDFANASFELPEFASIINSLPDEAQLTPETLKQIRELKLSKNRDNVKVTKNTAKRKTSRRVKNNIDSDVIGTMTFEFDSKDITDLLKDEKELQQIILNKSNNREDFKDLLFSISAQVVINKVFEYLKQNKSPELAKCLEENREFLVLPKNSLNQEMYSKASTLFDNSVKDAFSMNELRELVKSRFNSWKHYVASKFKSIPIELLENEIETMLDKFYSYIQDLAAKQCTNECDKINDKIDELRKNKDAENESDSEVCVSKESLKQISKLLSATAGSTIDRLIMKQSKMSQEKKSSVKGLKFKYIDVIRRCVESQELPGWILLDPEIAANVIQEMTGLPIKKTEILPDFITMSNDKKKEYFFERLREMNRQYMETLPKKALTGDEWLVMLYRLEQLEEKLKESFNKVNQTTKNASTQQNASEAEILAAKGLSKIIGKANVRTVKKTEPPKPIAKEERPNENIEVKEPKNDKEDDKKSKNDVLLAKCEAILTSKGEKSLLDSFYTIKSYITQGLPVPETYKNQVISICSSIDAKLLDEEIEETLKVQEKPEQDNLEAENSSNKDQNPLSVIGSQNPEMLAKYSAQALRNAKQTLNTVAFRNMMRNGQTKSESDACDTPKSECKWTNDCICNSCKQNDSSSVCLGDIVKQCYDMEAKNKNGLEEKKKDVKSQTKAPTKQPKPQAKVCESASHQQHICKVGHTGGGGPCAGEGAGADQPCTCCYCTVFGHAPPLTTPVPRNFNETRERLRSILNKKKQKCKTNGEQEIQEKKQTTVQTQTTETQHKQSPQIAPKPPALPKTLPPNLTAAQAQQKQQAIDNQQRQLTDKMAKMVVSEKPEINQQPKALQRTVPVQVNVPPTLRPDGKVNPNAMEQIRLQQMKQQQQDQQVLQQQTVQQKKPEPIYDLPIHNKPVVQQQQMRQQQLQQPQLQQPQQQQPQQQQPQQQQMNQQQQASQQPRQARPQQQQQQQRRTVSLSSRDTSVFSTSSGCSGAAFWHESRTEDPRDLDALLQYIEGPSRHVDRGKKRAKKQRQKAKKLEARLAAQREQLALELCRALGAAGSLRAQHAAARRSADDARRQLQRHHAPRKGKKHKPSPALQARMQLLAEQLGELNTLMNMLGRELQESERNVADYRRRLQHVEAQLEETRALQQLPHQRIQLEQAAMVNRQHLQQLEQQRQQLQQQQLEQQQMLLMEQQKQKQNAAIINAVGGAGAGAGGVVRVRRGAEGAVTVALAGRPDTPLAQLLHDTHVTAWKVEQPAPQPKPAESQRKQTWEQALAHINQLAKGSNKEKKKKETPHQTKIEAKSQKEQPKAQPTVETAPPLSKKQRKLLAKQQAEEEERKRQQQQKQQEAKNKKDSKKTPEPVKQDTNKKEKKAEVVKKQEPPPKKKEEKKETKKQEKEKENKKGKENKQEKIAPVPAAKPNKQPIQHQNKKDKKKEQSPKSQVINITPDTTIEVVSKQKPCTAEPDKPASCSIMEQLSSGVQVADLKLPPGITLTRVQPTEKKDAAPIKSVPLWKCNQLPATPTPVARPPPVINADPSMMMFTSAPPEPPKTILPEPSQPTGKSKKAKKKAKKAAAAAESEPQQEGAKMVTLRNPMFHPNLPPVQISTTPVQKKAEQIRIPDPIPMPPNACQATITPTSNGMYTIRNPLMSMMHQQSLMGLRNQSPQMPIFTQPQYNYVNPNVYTPTPNPNYTEAKASPKNEDYQNRIMNLASFTQKNDEGYSLFKTSEDNQQRSFLIPEYYVENQTPKPVVSPNPIGTRPAERSYDSNESSLFANPIQRPETIGTPLVREESSDFTGLYHPFGQEDRNVFRNALFNDKSEGVDGNSGGALMNGDPLPYFQRLRVGSKLNNEVTIHHVTESKFYKGQEAGAPPVDESLFAHPPPAWNNACLNNSVGACSSSSSEGGPACDSGAASPPNHTHAHAHPNPHSHPHPTHPHPHPHPHCNDEGGYGAVGTRHPPAESSVFMPDRSITNLSSLEVSEREIESFKRFDYFFEPPQHKPKVQLDVRDIAAALRQHHK